MTRDDGLNEFSEKLQAEVAGSKDIAGSDYSAHDAFTELMIAHLSEAGELDDGSACYYKTRGEEVSGYSCRKTGTPSTF